MNCITFYRDAIKKTRSAKAVLYYIENEEKATTAVNDIPLGRQAPNFSGLTP
ncbi:hypothetical protein N7U66_21020 [Lacinutrix neustonica]|uniref:Uncharacterized protein n=1 Tax=Lacinutrix neustonica TaxID=2980107 RepID=A0A9E8MX62_9FLAO|nr:hypothetical protein [Lacinutrix neustonica]WAC02202.1 hypothetical protein N7U66_21020 [Lacinutrix neustonica]